MSDGVHSRMRRGTGFQPGSSQRTHGQDAHATTNAGHVLTRRRFVELIGAAAVAAAMPRVSFGAAPSRRPNIIFILADDLGYGDLGCYGQKQIQTPNLDRMAAEGVRFTNAYSGSTVCAPSRCCLMTGYHTGHAIIRGNANVNLRPQDRTVAEVLKEAGYTTALIGKWGLGEEGTSGIPRKKGFDYFYGYLNQTHAHNSYPTFLYRNEQRVKLKNVVPNEGKVGQGIASERIEYSNDLFTQEALAFLDRSKDSPFFLYLTYTIPHANSENGKTGMEVPDLGIYKDKDWPGMQRQHAAMVTRLDGYVGQVLAKLKELGLDEDTIVFFTSDNGPHKEGGFNPALSHSSGPLRGIKRDMYEGGIRVPMIARWPGKIAAGRVSDQPWAFWDFMPTAAEIGDAPSPFGIDGISMLPALLGKKQQSHQFMYWEFHERGFDQAVRMGDWKAVRHGTTAPIELYDLRTDIGEKKNVAAEHPDVVRRIEEYLKTARTESKEFPIRERRPATRRATRAGTR